MTASRPTPWSPSHPLEVSVAAAVAVAAAATALSRLYADLRWTLPTAGLLVVLLATLLAARAVRCPAVLQPVFGVLVSGYVVLRWAVPSSLSFGLPTGRTGPALQALLTQATADVRTLAAPVPARPGVVLLGVLGVLTVALVTDVLAVLLRRPAVAGLPLLLLFAVPAGIRAGGVGVLPFVLGAAGYLVLLASDRRSSGELGPPTARSTLAGPAVGGAGWRIGTAALGAAALLPAVVPGLPGHPFSGGSGLSGHGPGHNATTFNPITRLRGELLASPAVPLFRYTTTDPDPDYLRLTTLDRFDGNLWSSSPLTADPVLDAVQRGIPTPVGLAGSPVPVRLVQDEISVTGLHTAWLPTPFPPKVVDIPTAWVWDHRSETVFSATRYADSDPSPYFVTASRVLPDAAALRDPGQLPAVVARYVAPVRLRPYVLAQTRLAVGSARTQLAKVLAVQQYFLDPHRFRYATTSNVPSVTSPDALERFLRGGQGYCEQYSSAMAAMLRYLHIPARVAVGFTPGHRQRDGSYLVTSHDAHSWPEVWFPGAGWVRFEPTPRVGVTTVPAYARPDWNGAAAGSGTTAAAPPAAGGAPSAAPTRPRTTGKNLDRSVRDASRGAPRLRPVRSSGGGSGVLVWVLVALLAGLLTAPSLVGIRRRTRRGNGGPAAAWAQLLADARDCGFRTGAAASPRASAHELLATRSLPAGAAAGVNRLALAAEQDRFGPSAVAAERTAAADLRAVRSALLGGVSAGRRAVVLLWPPSVLAEVRARLAVAVADLLDLVDRAAAGLAPSRRAP